MNANVLAERLEAIGFWMNDQVSANTNTGTMLIEAAKLLRVQDAQIKSLLEACEEERTDAQATT